MKKCISIVLVVVLLLCGTLINPLSVKAYHLFSSNYSYTIEKGGKIKLYYIVTGKTIRWWTSNKKLKIVKRNNKYCVVKGKKTGKCYVYAIIKQYGKKYKLKKRIKIVKKSKVTYDHYLDIYEGMSFSRVKKKLGKPYRHDSSDEYTDDIYNDDYDVIGYNTIRKDSYTWRNPVKGIYIYIDFENGKVTSMSYHNY